MTAFICIMYFVCLLSIII
ncbi:UNVERIFIED_CONTAM: hypothetical protein NCL1_25825 [Trichonephila clavipes]